MERKRRIYRHLKTLAEARSTFFESFRDAHVDTETIPVREALGRILSTPVQARQSVPAYPAAAMDGIAVKAVETFGALPENPVFLSKGQAVMVDTGDPLPEGADAVVMIENVEDAGDRWEVREAVYPWRNVRKTGEDMVKGEIILPARHRLRAYDLAALLAAGLLAVEVVKKPRVLIIPTGTEIVTPEEAPDPLPKGAILEVDGQMLASLSQQCGAVVQIAAPVPNILGNLKARLQKAVAEDYDLILVVAGCSAGSEDFTAPLLEEMGTLLVHGVAMMPGKPVLLAAVPACDPEGRDRQEKSPGKKACAGGRIPVIGIPGYAVSAALAFREFAGPLLYRMQGLQPPEAEKVEAVLARKLPSKLGLEELVRVLLGNVGGRLIATPIEGGAGVISSMVRADGLLRIEQESSGLREAETVEVELLVPREAVRNRLLVIGSHDLTIDLLGSLLKEKTGGRVQISSSNVGSLGGLLAVRKGTAHLAGAHLLDPETGEYNRSYIDRYVPDLLVTLITLVHRWQGFMVAPGNPRNIRGIRDLTRRDVMFVNRQSGSGTRVLLDYELGRAGMQGEQVLGYRHEEYTHLNVAMAIVSGAADVGLGIRAAADALSLDFIPLTKERYDLVIPTAYLKDEKICLLLEVIRSRDFQRKVLELGGYEVDRTGEVVEWTQYGPAPGED
jgi:molybdopterin biosynthesis enzyme/molybdate-binding protein